MLLCSWPLLYPPSPVADPTHSALHVDLEPRTPEQVSAFYAARGFPRQMVEILSNQCFITVRIHNTSDEVIWLELANWRFIADGEPLTRLHRDAWKARWQAMDVPLSSQSTFRWTLLPETLDFQPGEREGGNIILPSSTGSISVRAEFATGRDGKGPVIRRSFDNVHCGQSDN